MKTESRFFSTDSLTVGYNGKPLISDIAFDLKRGEIMTLIGPNGSGKSTILKSITRHIASISGVMYIEGKNMRMLSNRETATRLSVVLTERVKTELMTCGELVAAGRYPYTNNFGLLTAHDKEIVVQSLERVHAADLYDRDFSELSDGQRQRIMLARAICQEPEIIILDEPTSFLDIRHKIELLEILRDMAKKQNITVIMSLHEIDLAYKISDKIMCVKGEHISAVGKPDEIFTDSMIKNLYEIEKGSYDTLLGSVELESAKGKPEIFVIGGNGSGIPFYRALQKLSVAFTAGILFKNDIDFRVAKSLAVNVIACDAFVPIGKTEITDALSIIDKTPYVADCGCYVGEFNKANSILLDKARTAGKIIINSISALEEAF